MSRMSQYERPLKEQEEQTTEPRDRSKEAKLKFDAPSTDIADKAVERLTEQIRIPFPDAEIDIKIQKCTEGSRCGRICCSELGVGWIVLQLTWQLRLREQALTEPRPIKLRDSAAIGFVDVCDSNYGENTLLNNMTSEVSNQISTQVVRLLQASDNELLVGKIDDSKT